MKVKVNSFLVSSTQYKHSFPVGEDPTDRLPGRTSSVRRASGKACAPRSVFSFKRLPFLLMSAVDAYNLCDRAQDSMEAALKRVKKMSGSEYFTAKSGMIHEYSSGLFA